MPSASKEEIKPPYVCAECGRAVILIETEIIRACEHSDSGVIANMQATAYGIGTAQP